MAHAMCGLARLDSRRQCVLLLPRRPHWRRRVSTLRCSGHSDDRGILQYRKFTTATGTQIDSWPTALRDNVAHGIFSR